MNSKSLLANAFFFFGSVVLIGYLLSAGKPFLQPIIVAIILWYLIISLTQLFSTGWKQFKLPEPLALTLAIVACGLSLFAMSQIISHNAEQINAKLPAYQANFIYLTESLLQKYAPNNQLDAATFLREEVFYALNMSDLISSTAKTLGGTAGKFGLVLVYTIFLLLEYKKFPAKLEAITEKGANYAKTVSILKDVSTDLNSYFKIKTVASLATAFLSYIVMLAFQVDFAAFWALIIFLLNYIPTVGSPIATAFPIIITLVQYGGDYRFVAVGILLIFVQLLIGSIWEPRYQGNTLNISPLVIVLSLAFWASLWGVLGALLCIPITAILNVVLSKFERTQWISLLISADGKGKNHHELQKWHKQLKKQVKKFKG